MRELAARFAASTAGLTAEQITLIVAVGFVLGTFPVPGCATILCIAAGAALRLNLAPLQAAGQLATPAQYALLVPLTRVGARVAGAHAGIAGVAVHAVTGWLCVCVPLGAILYGAVVHLLRGRLRDRMGAVETAA